MERYDEAFELIYRACEILGIYKLGAHFGVRETCPSTGEERDVLVGITLSNCDTILENAGNSIDVVETEVVERGGDLELVIEPELPN